MTSQLHNTFPIDKYESLTCLPPVYTYLFGKGDIYFTWLNK